jgi:hypothetical protein
LKEKNKFAYAYGLTCEHGLTVDSQQRGTTRPCSQRGGWHYNYECENINNHHIIKTSENFSHIFSHLHVKDRKLYITYEIPHS